MDYYFFNSGVAVISVEKLKEAMMDNNVKQSELVIKKGYYIVHVSFQSTSSCNFIIVNTLYIQETMSMFR